MKRILIISAFSFGLFLISGTNVYAAPDPTGKKVIFIKKTKYKSLQFSGAKYIVSSQQRLPLSFSKKYTKMGKYTFKTTYDIYNLQKEQICRVTAIHNKNNKSIEVSVKDLQIAGFPIVNIERTSYETPFTGRFGAIGKVGASAKGKSHIQSPGQLTLSFLNKKFDYVKVVHIADAHEDSGKDLQIFILEE